MGLVMMTGVAEAQEIIDYNQDGYDYITNNTEYTTYLKANSNWGDGTKYCVNTIDGEKCLTYQVQDMSYRDVNGGQDYMWVVQNTQGEINNNTINYPEVFPNVNLTYTITKNTMKENFILAEKPREPVEWLQEPITLDFGGYIKWDTGVELWSEKEEKTKDFITSDKIFFKYNNEIIYSLDLPNAADEHGNNSVYLQYEVKKRGNQIWFYVRTPYEWINNDSVSYPRVIDPSVVTTNMTIWFPLNETSGTEAQNFGNSPELGGTTTTNDGYDFIEDTDGIYRLWGKGLSTTSFPNAFELNTSESGQLDSPAGIDMSFCMVVNMKSTSYVTEPKLVRFNTGGDERVFYINSSKKVRMLWHDRSIDTSATFDVEKIYHYCFTFDNSANTGRVYVNGTLDNTNTGMDQDFASNPSDFYIGHRDFNQYINATMGNVRFWNGYLLSASEVADVFNTDLNVSGEEPPAENDTNYVDCSTSPVTNESRTYNSTAFMNGTGTWEIKHNITWEGLAKPRSCKIAILHGEGRLAYKK